MDIFLSLCLGLGMGIVAGVALASTGQAESPRRPLGLISILAGALLAGAVASLRDETIAAAVLGGLLGAAVAIAALGALIAAARMRSGAAAAVALWTAGLELVVAVATLLFAPLALLALALLAWIGLARRRRGARKYKGLRSLT